MKNQRIALKKKEKKKTLCDVWRFFFENIEQFCSSLSLAETNMQPTNHPNEQTKDRQTQTNKLI